jgi:ring-1,2-phenylacetyl-CoA epoxidase subunit PaaE
LGNSSINLVASAGLSPALATKLIDELPKLNVHKMDYYLCGPQGMIEEMQQTLLAMNVPAEKIHKESFVTAPAPGTATPEAQSNSVIKTEEVTLRYDGSEYKIKVSPNKTILEAGLDSGIDLPYSCQSGLCTACRGKRISGKVKMDEEDGLSPQELKEGYVLPCVSHPLSPDVVIEIG